MIGIDIISGFLGSGKTTFANILLKHYLNTGERPVFIVNEFGSTGIDAQIAESNGFSAVNLEGGCICCTLKQDIKIAVKEIITAFSPTRIVFEPSGIFVFDNFFDILKDEYIKEHCFINSIITIADPLIFKKASLTALAGSFIENQIKNSATIIISKLEKFNDDLTGLICDISNINSNAVIIAKPFNELKPADLHQIIIKKSDNKQISTGVRHKSLMSCTVNVKKSFNDYTLNRFIQNITAGHYGTVYRVKGTIKLKDTRILLNMVFNDADITEQSFSNNSELTFIGSSLNLLKIKNLSF